MNVIWRGASVGNALKIMFHRIGIYMLRNNIVANVEEV